MFAIYKYKTKKGPMKIIWYPRVDSTNTQVSREASTLDNMSVVAAVEQYAGRGQRGNRWVAAPGENLTFSVLLRPGEPPLEKLPAARQFCLSEASTLSVRDTLSEYGIESTIKWPNDIYIQRRKVSGMLIENSIADGFVSKSIVGIGINVNQTAFDPSLANPTSMKKATGKDYDIRQVLSSFTPHFERYLSMDPDRRHSLYLESLYQKGRKCPYRDNVRGEEFEGIIKEVSPGGILRVEDAAGEDRFFSFKEISYIL